MHYKSKRLKTHSRNGQDHKSHQTTNCKSKNKTHNSHILDSKNSCYKLIYSMIAIASLVHTATAAPYIKEYSSQQDTQSYKCYKTDKMDESIKTLSYSGVMPNIFDNRGLMCRLSKKFWCYDSKLVGKEREAMDHFQQHGKYGNFFSFLRELNPQYFLKHFCNSGNLAEKHTSCSFAPCPSSLICFYQSEVMHCPNRLSLIETLRSCPRTTNQL